MRSLSDLRVRSYDFSKSTSEADLGKILWSVCQILIFSKTKKTNDSAGDTVKVTFDYKLYYHGVPNISQIIKSQTDLQILGLYTLDPRDIQMTLKELHDAQLFIPIALTLQFEGVRLCPNHISIFPSFYSVDRRATIAQALSQSLLKNKANYLSSTPDNFVELSIYLIDSCNIMMPSISALAKDMAMSFRRISRLNLSFKHRCGIVSFLLTVMTKTTPN